MARYLLKNFINVMICYIFFITIVACAMGNVTLRQSEMLLLASLNSVLMCNMLKNKSVRYSAIFLFVLYLTLIPLKISIFSYVDLTAVTRYISFVIAVISFYCIAMYFITRITFYQKFSSVLSSIIFFPLLCVWTYYCVSGEWISADTVVAIMQTNFMESLEYVKMNFNEKNVVAIILAAIIILYTNKFVLKIKESRCKIGGGSFINFT